MKIVATLLLVAGLGFFAGLRYAPPAPTPAEHSDNLSAEFIRISKEELEEYRSLQDQRARFNKANQILAQVMKVFIADLGLRISPSTQICRIGTAESPGKLRQEMVASEPAATPPDVKPAATAAVAAEPPGTASVTAKTPAKSAAGSRADPANWRRGPVEPEKAKGAVHALYQAVLWRAPDDQGGAEATQKMSEDGWEAYLRNARGMIRSPEFLQEVEPNHTPVQIINHMYGVYFGRCAFPKELESRLNVLRGEGAGGVIAGVIRDSRRRHADQIFKGGYSPTSCPR